MAHLGGYHVKGTELDDMEVKLYRQCMAKAEQVAREYTQNLYSKGYRFQDVRPGRPIGYVCHAAHDWAEFWADYSHGKVSVHHLMDAVQLGYVPAG